MNQSVSIENSPTIAYHIPVLVHEVASWLVWNPRGTYVDCTLGGGGHAAHFLEHYPELTVIGFDQDRDAVEYAGKHLERFGDRIKIYHSNFGSIRDVLVKEQRAPVDGIFADLGISSHQVDAAERGFSFVADSLDMRMDRRNPETAEELLNTAAEEELARIFYEYGEERFSRPIARRIVQERLRTPITSAAQLVRIISSVKRRHGRINPATQVFQGLRIAVNHEIDNLRLLLEAIPSLLVPQGRAVLLSYHSLEDRPIKQYFKQCALEGSINILTKKVIMPSREEMSSNRRARSAKLRCAEKL